MHYGDIYVSLSWPQPFCWLLHYLNHSQYNTQFTVQAYNGQPKLDWRGLVMKHWLSRCFLIICNRFWLSIIPDIWAKGFSPVSYLGEIQASFFAAVLSDRSFWHTSCKIEHHTWTASMLKWLENSSAEHWFNKQNNPLLAAWHKIHFTICNWLVESTNCFGFVAALFADFDRLWLPC